MDLGQLYWTIKNFLACQWYFSEKSRSLFVPEVECQGQDLREPQRIRRRRQVQKIERERQKEKAEKWRDGMGWKVWIQRDFVLQTVHKWKIAKLWECFKKNLRSSHWLISLFWLSGLWKSKLKDFWSLFSVSNMSSEVSVGILGPPIFTYGHCGDTFWNLNCEKT